MLLISHRGNLNGSNSGLENSELYIVAALEKGFEVEIDVWKNENGDLYLGHDVPTYKTNLDFLDKYKDKLWIHCKNLLALDYLLTLDGFNFFWHESDDYTLTSKKYIWTYFNKSVLGKNVIVVKEKIDKDQLPNCFGICSDFVEFYR